MISDSFKKIVNDELLFLLVPIILFVVLIGVAVIA